MKHLQNEFHKRDKRYTSSPKWHVNRVGGRKPKSVKQRLMLTADTACFLSNHPCHVKAFWFKMSVRKSLGKSLTRFLIEMKSLVSIIGDYRRRWKIRKLSPPLHPSGVGANSAGRSSNLEPRVLFAPDVAVVGGRTLSQGIRMYNLHKVLCSVRSMGGSGLGDLTPH